MKHVVVVEDNEDLLDEVVFYLGSKEGFQVFAARNGLELDACLAAQRIDIVILDLGLPGESGLDIARRLRRDTAVGIVMLTARGALGDRIFGLETGADAYLVKPVDMRELVAVIDSVYRRLPVSETVEPAAWVFYPLRWQLRTPLDSVLSLTAAESRVLGVLAEAAGQTVPRHELAAVEGMAALDFDYRRLESTISRLRRKLDADQRGSPLRAARGQGYAFIEAIRIA
jgi:two-component system OmpR family response regulator